MYINVFNQTPLRSITPPKRQTLQIYNETKPASAATQTRFTASATPPLSTVRGSPG